MRAVVALAFSILFVWYSPNTGLEHRYVTLAPFLMAAAGILADNPGVPVAAHHDDGSTPAPVPAHRERHRK